jgi:hypothetical protein
MFKPGLLVSVAGALVVCAAALKTPTNPAEIETNFLKLICCGGPLDK